MLSKLRSVLPFYEEVDGMVAFGALDAEIVDGEDVGSDRFTVISSADWQEMSSPQEVTVTIRPGDRLNQ